MLCTGSFVASFFHWPPVLLASAACFSSILKSSLERKMRRWRDRCLPGDGGRQSVKDRRQSAPTGGCNVPFFYTVFPTAAVCIRSFTNRRCVTVLSLRIAQYEALLSLLHKYSVTARPELESWSTRTACQSRFLSGAGKQGTAVLTRTCNETTSCTVAARRNYLN